MQDRCIKAEIFVCESVLLKLSVPANEQHAMHWKEIKRSISSNDQFIRCSIFSEIIWLKMMSIIIDPSREFKIIWNANWMTNWGVDLTCIISGILSLCELYHNSITKLYKVLYCKYRESMCILVGTLCNTMHDWCVSRAHVLAMPYNVLVIAT